LNDKHLYKFGAFELRADESVLHRGGEALALTPKMFDTLLVLVRHHGQIVDKDTFLKEVWPDSFVEEGNIAFNIRQIRKVLGDDAQDPTYIETVPRRGYRFIADVEVAAPEITRASNGAENLAERFAGPKPPGFKRPFHPFLVAFVAFIVLIGAGLAYLALNRPTAALPVLTRAFASEKLSTNGSVFGAAVSPDGKTVVYSVKSGSKQSVWLRQLDTGTNVPFLQPVEEFYFGFNFAPDGNTIYFARGSGDPVQVDVYRVSIRGGIPERLITNTSGPHSISSDGSRIIFVRCPREPAEWCSLWMADAATGGSERKLISYPDPIRISDAAFSPDGKKVAMAVGQSRNAANEFRLVEYDIATQAERPISGEQFFNIKNLAWLPDQSGVLVTASRIPNKYFRIWSVSAATGAAEALTKDSEAYSILSIDRAGEGVVSTQIKQDFQMYRVELDGVANKRLLAAGVRPRFAPDGKLYFSSVMSGNDEIWSMDREGNDQRQLTNDLAGDATPWVSPDNRSVYFVSNRSGEAQLWKMNVDGSGQSQVTKGGGGPPLHISQDGRVLYYHHAFLGNVWSIDLGSGEEKLIIDQPWVKVAFAPNGDLVASVDERTPDRGLEVASPDGKAPVRNFPMPPGRSKLLDIGWMPDGKSLMYLVTDQNYADGMLFQQFLDGSGPRLLMDLKDEELSEIAGFAIAPDGRSIVLVLGGWRHDAVLLRGLK